MPFLQDHHKALLRTSLIQGCRSYHGKGQVNRYAKDSCIDGSALAALDETMHVC